MIKTFKNDRDYVILEKDDNAGFYVIQVYESDGSYRYWVADQHYEGEESLTDFIENVDGAHVDECKNIKEATSEINKKEVKWFETEEDIYEYLLKNKEDNFRYYVCSYGM